MRQPGIQDAAEDGLEGRRRAGPGGAGDHGSGEQGQAVTGWRRGGSGIGRGAEEG